MKYSLKNLNLLSLKDISKAVDHSGAGKDNWLKRSLFKRKIGLRGVTATSGQQSE